MGMKKNAIDWDDLVARIESGNVIPVVGQGLYRLTTPEHPEGIFLYDYLAEKLAGEMGIQLTEKRTQRFSKMVLEFLQRKGSGFNVFKELRNLLNGFLSRIATFDFTPLRQLARIGPFQLFINTTYDDFLVEALRQTRVSVTRYFHYSLQSKRMDLLDDQLFNDLEKSGDTLVYNIYGNLNRTPVPAFTEKDMLETIYSFQENLLANPHNGLGPKLKSSSLLFMGCGYDDWFFRFFVRTLSNREYDNSVRNYRNPWRYVGDAFGGNVKDPFDELPRFLTCYDSDVCNAESGGEFVETLYGKLDVEPGESGGVIIPVSRFPASAFISFHGANREVAFRLADRLEEDGIKVWVDKREFEPGAEVDQTIFDAMGGCRVFIPLISRESEELMAPNGVEKYHVQEWNWVYLFNHKNRDGSLPSKRIIPVVIDDTGWQFEKFKSLYHLKIPNGVGGEYETLKNVLK